MKYWDDKGKHSKMFDEIWNENVPLMGEASDEISEAVRCFGRINYDMGNNGGGNLCDDEYPDNNYGWYDDDEEEEEEMERVINESGMKYFDELERWVGSELISKLKSEVINLSLGGDWKAVKYIDEVGDALGDAIKKFQKKLDSKKQAV